MKLLFLLLMAPVGSFAQHMYAGVERGKQTGAALTINARTGSAGIGGGMAVVDFDQVKQAGMAAYADLHSHYYKGRSDFFSFAQGGWTFVNSATRSGGAMAAVGIGYAYGKTLRPFASFKVRTINYRVKGIGHDPQTQAVFSVGVAL